MTPEMDTRTHEGMNTNNDAEKRYRKRRLLPSRRKRQVRQYKSHCWVAVYLPLVEGVDRTGIWENYDLDTKAGRLQFKVISDAYAGRL